MVVSLSGRLKLLAAASKGTNFAGRVGSTSGNARSIGNRPPCRPDRVRVTLTSCTPMRLGLTQDEQILSSASSRKGNVETRLMRWLSGFNPMAGSWSLATYPRTYRPVSPSEKLLAITSHFVGRSAPRNRRLGDFPQKMVKRQEESLGHCHLLAFVRLASFNSHRPASAAIANGFLLTALSNASANTRPSASCAVRASDKALT
jgi:hypothetical protein